VRVASCRMDCRGCGGVRRAAYGVRPPTVSQDAPTTHAMPAAVVAM
jgi:hypothetical protein